MPAGRLLTQGSTPVKRGENVTEGMGGTFTVNLVDGISTVGKLLVCVELV